MYQKRTPAAKRIEKYESFMDAQQNAEQRYWLNVVPLVLADLSIVIQSLKVKMEDTDKAEKLATNTLPALRSLYQSCKDTMANPEMESYEKVRITKDAISSMMTKVNSWFRASRIAVGIEVTYSNHYGRAKIAIGYKVVSSDSFEITAKHF